MKRIDSKIAGLQFAKALLGNPEFQKVKDEFLKLGAVGQNEALDAILSHEEKLSEILTRAMHSRPKIRKK